MLVTVTKEFKRRGEIVPHGTTIDVPDEMLVKLAGYVIPADSYAIPGKTVTPDAVSGNAISNVILPVLGIVDHMEIFRCYCGGTKYRTGVNGWRSCVRCQAPEASIIRRASQMGAEA